MPRCCAFNRGIKPLLRQDPRVITPRAEGPVVNTSVSEWGGIGYWLLVIGYFRRGWDLRASFGILTPLEMAS